GGGVVVRVPAEAELAEAAAGELPLSADPDGVYPGRDCHDRVGRHFPADRFVDGAGHHRDRRRRLPPDTAGKLELIVDVRGLRFSRNEVLPRCPYHGRYSSHSFPPLT